MEINKQNGSIIINESDIKNMIKESINRMIKYYMDSGIFSDYPLLSKLEKLLYLFGGISIDVNDYYNINNWEDVIEAIGSIYEQAKEKELFISLNVKEIFAQCNGDWDAFEEYLREKGYDYNNWEYITEYLDEPEAWESQMPSIEEIKSMVAELKKWAGQRFDWELEDKIKEIKQQKEWVISNIERDIY